MSADKNCLKYEGIRKRTRNSTFGKKDVVDEESTTQKKLKNNKNPAKTEPEKTEVSKEPPESSVKSANSTRTRKRNPKFNAQEMKKNTTNNSKSVESNVKSKLIKSVVNNSAALEAKKEHLLKLRKIHNEKQEQQKTLKILREIASELKTKKQNINDRTTLESTNSGVFNSEFNLFNTSDKKFQNNAYNENVYLKKILTEMHEQNTLLMQNKALLEEKSSLLDTRVHKINKTVLPGQTTCEKLKQIAEEPLILMDEDTQDFKSCNMDAQVQTVYSIENCSIRYNDGSSESVTPSCSDFITKDYKCGKNNNKIDRCDEKHPLKIKASKNVLHDQRDYNFWIFLLVFCSLFFISKSHFLFSLTRN